MKSHRFSSSIILEENLFEVSSDNWNFPRMADGPRCDLNPRGDKNNNRPAPFGTWNLNLW